MSEDIGCTMMRRPVNDLCWYGGRSLEEVGAMVLGDLRGSPGLILMQVVRGYEEHNKKGKIGRFIDSLLSGNPIYTREEYLIAKAELKHRIENSRRVKSDR